MEDMVSFLSDLPIELLHVLASHNVKVYRGLVLTCKRFSASLTPSTVVDYKLAFGYSVRITNGYTSWLLNEYRHRTGGPAAECADGTKMWYVNGKRHRMDGPAIEWATGSKEWWVNGERHRTDGPAIERSDGTEEWHVNGEYHRINGPAVEWRTAIMVREYEAKMWYINKIKTDPDFCSQ